MKDGSSSGQAFFHDFALNSEFIKIFTACDQENHFPRIFPQIQENKAAL
jgi:hypothetical protein